MFDEREKTIWLTSSSRGDEVVKVRETAARSFICTYAAFDLVVEYEIDCPAYRVSDDIRSKTSIEAMK